jgi:type II secretory pathway component PulK
MKKSLENVGPTTSRRGAAMVFALMALLVASMMMAALLRTTAMSHRQLKRDEYRLQANLLADAGCDRALMLLKIKPEFTTEEWKVPSEQLSPERTASVRLSITPDRARPERRIVSVIAEYPTGHPDLVRVTRYRPVP